MVYFVGTVHPGGGWGWESMVIVLLRLGWQECEARDRRGNQLGP